MFKITPSNNVYSMFCIHFNAATVSDFFPSVLAGSNWLVQYGERGRGEECRPAHMSDITEHHVYVLWFNGYIINE